MMSKEFLKKLGIVGISLGLTASPLAFADFHEEEQEPDPAPMEDAGPDGNTEPGVDYDTTEEENEEEEFDYEEENEEEEWETPDEDDEDAW
ncbi:hypothetical protein [Billgrantia endophytica]|uniref:Uncharacterized protein n=1 Tax=Billgrantia endophytica TaxID=2033802 RepID=A0A2N7U9M5_9GAMM|nr:hypothetical protein [Halomonas endophytica]PMR77147.1 hypothetical protein C1H69_03720 [Halomonas endophytica]